MILESLAFDGLALPRTQKYALLRKYGSAQAILKASQRQRGLVDKKDEVLALVKRGMDLKEAEKREKKILRAGIQILTYGSEAYPKSLLQLHDPPILLFLKGTLPEGEHPLAMIGSRSPTPYGRRIARMLSEDLVRQGIILISGLARGIDSIGHEAAARQGRPTVAVMGTSLDRVYPSEHQLLAKEILDEGGAWLSEFPLGTPPRRENFPQRNRMIAALAKGILVVEAGEKSGTRSTVNHGLDLGRDIFAVPGPIDSPLSLFPNLLISQGACLVSNTSAILQEWKIETDGRPGKAPLRYETLPKGLREVAGLLDPNEPQSVEDLVRQGAGEASEILQALATLELEGWVQKQVNGQFVLARPAS